jgi:hypothetical protein
MGDIYRPPPTPPPTAESSPAMKQIREEQARKIAPHGGAETALKISDDLRKGKQPDVHRKLETGELSRDELGKLLKASGSTHPEEDTASLPLPDLVGAAEAGSTADKRMLVPIIMKRMQAELPRMQNKTMQAKLAQRLRTLQLAVNGS